MALIGQCTTQIGPREQYYDLDNIAHVAPSACVYTATLKEGLMLIHTYLFSLMFPCESYKYNGSRGVRI